MLKKLFLLSILMLGAGCSSVQHSSGIDYLHRFQSDVAGLDRKSNVSKLDPEIWNAASAEPILRFPAKIGLARIEDGRITDIPEEETLDWQLLSERSAAVTKFEHLNLIGLKKFRQPYWRPNIKEPSLTKSIRIAAARQHLDAIIVYEIDAKTRKNNTVLAIADLTIVGGAILPTRVINSEASARMSILDVRNGYNYGSAAVVSELKKFSTSWGSNERRVEIENSAKKEAYTDLSIKTETMLSELATKMAKRNGR